MKNDAAVVVGVGPGLGSSLVRRFASAGYGVVAAARRASALIELNSGDNAESILLHDCDATQPNEVSALFDKVTAKFGPLRVAIFNAGAYEPGRIVDIDPEDFKRCWQVGCYAGFLVAREATKLMLKEQRGTIVLTGATASLRGSAGFANLASSKFALRALAQSMARELGPQNIHVAHVIIDGQIRSGRYEHLLNERGPDSLLEPDAIADAYLELHRQPRSAWTHELDLRPWSEKF